MIQRLIVPLDGSAARERALPWARAMADSFDAAIMLVRLCDASQKSARLLSTMWTPFDGGIHGPTVSTMMDGLVQTELRRTLAYLERVAVPLRAAGYEVETYAPEALTPDALRLLARPGSMVVAGRARSSWLKRLFRCDPLIDALDRCAVPVLNVCGDASVVPNGKSGRRGGPHVAGVTLPAPLALRQAEQAAQDAERRAVQRT